MDSMAIISALVVSLPNESKVTCEHLLIVVAQNIFVELHDKHEDALQSITKM